MWGITNLQVFGNIQDNRIDSSFRGTSLIYANYYGTHISPYTTDITTLTLKTEIQHGH